MCPLVLGEISGVFVNTLTSDANYSVQGYENLQLPIQMQSLNILRENMILIANVFPKLQTMKILVRPLSKKPHFRRRFDSQRVKTSEIVAKSP